MTDEIRSSKDLEGHHFFKFETKQVIGSSDHCCYLASEGDADLTAPGAHAHGGVVEGGHAADHDGGGTGNPRSGGHRDARHGGEDTEGGGGGGGDGGIGDCYAHAKRHDVGHGNEIHDVGCGCAAHRTVGGQDHQR